jgi:hypothetical protein
MVIPFGWRQRCAVTTSKGSKQFLLLSITVATSNEPICELLEAEIAFVHWDLPKREFNCGAEETPATKVRIRSIAAKKTLTLVLIAKGYLLIAHPRLLISRSPICKHPLQIFFLIFQRM